MTEGGPARGLRASARAETGLLPQTIAPMSGARACGRRLFYGPLLDESLRASKSDRHRIGSDYAVYFEFTNRGRRVNVRVTRYALELVRSHPRLLCRFAATSVGRSAVVMGG